MEVAEGAALRGKTLRARDTAVEASDDADLSAEEGSASAENLRTTMQKDRHVNKFKRSATARVCISLDD